MDDLELTKTVFRKVAPRPEARAEARARLDAAMHRPQRSRRRLPALLAAAVVALLLVVVPMVVDRWQPSAAAQALERIAALSGTVLPELGPDEVIYREFRQRRPDERTDLESGIRYALILQLRVEEWIARDLSGTRRETIVAVSFATDEDRSAWIDAGRPLLPSQGDVLESNLPPGELDFVPAELVPTEPPRLEDALWDGSIAVRSPEAPHVFRLIGDLLAQGNLGQDARMALLQVAAELDGIELVGPVTDPAGRPGLALSVMEGSLETELLFDETDGDLLASITRDAQGESWTAYLGTEVVDAPLDADGTG